MRVPSELLSTDSGFVAEGGSEWPHNQGSDFAVAR
jgi:hypothetical protein